MKHATPLSIALLFSALLSTSSVWSMQPSTGKDNHASDDTFTQLFNQANSLVGSNVQQAIALYRKALSIKNNIPQVYFNLGICLQNIGNKEEALSAFNEAARLEPGYAKAQLHRGLIYKDMQKAYFAVEALTAAAKHDAQSWEAHYNLGLVLRDINNFGEAISHLQTAVSLNPTHVNTLFELASTYHMVDNPSACLALYEKVLMLLPQSSQAQYNYAFTLKKLGYYTSAIELYDRILAKEPNYANVHFSKSLALLTLGDFEQGWIEYEWRWKAYDEDPITYKSPVWHGEDPAQKTILIYAEQGLGDTFQFIRYGKELKDRGARVIAIVQRPLKALLSLCPYLDSVICQDDPIPPHDAHCALMSLPLAFKTKLETIPANIPYLYADSKLVEEWHKKLAGDTSFKIGICWQGNAQYRTQYLRQAVAAKSMQLQDFTPLASIPGVHLYNLQRVNGIDQLAINPKITLVNFDESFDRDHGRFMDTAALMRNLDLVITIDTSIAHLAGGLGVPVWVILPYPADWRWLLERTDTPWYLTMRLIRQQKTGDWSACIGTIATLLKPLIELHKKISTSATTPSAEQIDAYCMLCPSGLARDLITLKNQPLDTDQQALSNLLNELNELNNKLWMYETLLHKNACSFFDPQFLELTHQAHMAAMRKEDIKRYINTFWNSKQITQ